ncbi:transcription factor PAR1 [Senna tora]|uniref:Transcription factor PAR1 n=1 Tax=Senna tora TaxID=362788 RepID=A0A834WWC5_9FABA|nr:transcription factor PAR1 [Senna tora]
MEEPQISDTTTTPTFHSTPTGDSPRRSRRRRRRDSQSISNSIRKISKRIVPGGESLGMEKLFDETAGYIMALQCQVKGLRALASFFEKLDKKENAKLGA